ncbi:hypothetical protein F5884DRAFT_888917 [Xylogone sp. PMI_703]|nr:hypothetical protein F5884DRAFT_888917 [Xylogone sp. PMI_703]
MSKPYLVLQRMLDLSLYLFLCGFLTKFTTRFTTRFTIWFSALFSFFQDEYHETIQTASQNTLEDYTKGLITAGTAIEKAHGERNNAMSRMREKTKPTGLLIAKLWKRATLPRSYYLERNALKNFNKPFEALSLEEKNETYIETVKSAGRPQLPMTRVLKVASIATKLGLIVSVGVSLQKIMSADDWVNQLLLEIWWVGCRNNPGDITIQVYTDTIYSAGRPQYLITMLLKVASIMTRIGLMTQVGISLYRIICASNWLGQLMGPPGDGHGKYHRG